MAEPHEIADSGKSVAPEFKAELPNVDSPPLSPGEKLAEPILEAQIRPAAPKAPDIVTQTAAPKLPPKPLPRAPHLAMPPIKIPQVKISSIKMPAFGMTRRIRRRAALAATVMLAAGFGAAIGAIANRAPEQTPPKPDMTLLEENHALQRSVTKLTKDLGGLKASVETAARESRSQIAKVTERIDRADRSQDVTGSIGKTAATPASTPAAPPVIDKPEIIAAPPMPTPRPTIVQGWMVREVRNGQAIVESRGEFFRVAPGVPLPGLGRVEAVRREGGGWVVVTQKGLITTAESSAAAPQRSGYPPYYRRF